MGAISFPLYAVHMPLIYMAKPLAHGPLGWAMMAAAALVLALVVEYGIDRPFRIYLKSKRSKTFVASEAALAI